MKLPKPLANRDFVTQRSWQDNGLEKLIVNHSVTHKVSLLVLVLILTIHSTTISCMLFCLNMWVATSKCSHDVVHAVVVFVSQCVACLKDFPPRHGIVRGVSYLTGYRMISTVSDADKDGCEVTYLTQSDPKGT